MSERLSPQPEQEQRSTKTHDYRYPSRGWWSDSGICRIRIYQPENQTPAVICSDLPENENTSITNMAEFLAAEIIQRHFPHRFEEEDPLVWIEHYERDPHDPMVNTGYSLVEFDSYSPHKVFRGGIERIKIGTPNWSHLELEQVEDLTGESFGDQM